MDKETIKCLADKYFLGKDYKPPKPPAPVSKIQIIQANAALWTESEYYKEKYWRNKKHGTLVEFRFLSGPSGHRIVHFTDAGGKFWKCEEKKFLTLFEQLEPI